MNGDENCKDSDIWDGRKCKWEEGGLVGNGRLFFFLSSLINKSGVSKMLILGLLR